MDILSAFDISAAGMSLERLRLDVSAVNLANANTTRAPDGTLFQPLQVVARPVFEDVLEAAWSAGGAGPGGMSTLEVSIERSASAPRLVYEPDHPAADERGYVAYPDVNPVSEMLQLISVSRAYEANVRVMNATKSMALKALEIGGNP